MSSTFVSKGEWTNGWSRALFGGLLWGESPVRFLFVDEAGTSAREPVTVVVALIAHADEHVMSAEALVHETLGGVPPQHKEGFVFHATQVYNDKKYQKDWSMTDRLILLREIMTIPRRIGMGIAVSAVWRNGIDISKHALKLGITNCQFDHMQAFGLCMAVADRNIRRNAGPREVATIVAEDVPEMRKFLKKAVNDLTDRPTHLGPEGLRLTERDKQAGYNVQSGELRITRIRKAIHFVGKADDPLVQVADACAYGIRRYFAGEKFGPEFANDILGDHTLLSQFASPSGAVCWWPPSSSNFG